jgi:putative endonuclease
MAERAGTGRLQGNRAHGAYGEALAARWYEARGLTVLDRNWRAGRAGEIDLVVGSATLVVFCEVKARASSAYGDAFEAVTQVKQARIRRVAAVWLAQHPAADGRRDVRFDVAAVRSGKVEVIEAAF